MTSPEKLIGRDGEQAQLERIFAAACEGRGTTFLLAGEAGVGKTALARQALDASGLPVFTGRATEEANPPYGPLAVAMRACLRLLPAGARPPEALARHLALLLPELGAPPEGGDRDTLVEALRVTLMAPGSPVALFLDDLQWADNATLELLPLLAERLHDAPVVILGTYRSDEIPAGHPLRRYRNELRRTRRLREALLRSLDEGGSALLAQRVLGGAVSPDLAAAVFAQTQGLPLFVEELAGSLLAEGRIRAGASGFELVPGEHVPLPESLRDALLLRLHDLSEPARRQLEVAALLGLEFDLQFVTRLSGTEAAVEELIASRFVSEPAPGRGAFRHALTRAAVSGEIGWSRRRALHRQIAACLERGPEAPERVAEHWLAANELERARAALLRSAEHSCRVHAYRDAARAAERALEIWPEGEDEDDRLAALEQLAHCARASGRLNEAARAWREVLESPALAGAAGKRGTALRALATVYGLQGVWGQAMEAREGAARAFVDGGQPGEAALEQLAAAGHLTATLQLSPALAMIRQALERAAQAGRIDIQARAGGLRGTVLAMQGHFQEGREVVEAALALALRHNLAEAASDVYRRLGSVLEYASDYSAAREAYRTALEYCRTQGAEREAQLCLGCMSGALFQSGDWKRAASVCREVCAGAATPAATRAVAVTIQGLIHAHRGESARARKQLSEAAGLARRQEVAVLEMMAAWGLAVVAEQQGDDEQAGAHYRQLLRRWGETRDRHDAIPALCAAATFFAERGLEEQTAQCADALGFIASVAGSPEALAGLAHCLGESALARGAAGDAAQQFVQAVQHMDKLELPLERAKSLWRAGVALRRFGSRDDGVARLKAAQGLARKLGARPLAARIAAEVSDPSVTSNAKGAAVRERAPRGALTRRQMEVLRLVSQGLTNKQIAGGLFVSPRTVDMHVTTILNRLDCRSRAEAVRKAGEFGLLDAPPGGPPRDD